MDFFGGEDSGGFHEVDGFLEAILLRNFRAKKTHPQDVADFWAKSESFYPHFPIVALRIIDTPAYSESRKLYFIDVGTILTTNPWALDPYLVNVI